jgi:diguanylate cyclase (GGDEF)-like protein
LDSSAKGQSQPEAAKDSSFFNQIGRQPGRQVERWTLPGNLVKNLIARILEDVAWEKEKGFLLLMLPEESQQNLAKTAAQVLARKTTRTIRSASLLYYSGKIRSLPSRKSNELLLIAGDGRRCALVAARLHSDPLPSLIATPAENTFDAFLTISRKALQAHAAKLADVFPGWTVRGEAAEALNASLPTHPHRLDWKVFDLEAALHSERELRENGQELAWARFGVELEEKLGLLFEPEHILQTFSDLLKLRLPYSYLEVSLLGNSLSLDSPQSEWVRNDTGYGGKLLTIILSPEFVRGLRWRRNPLVLTLENTAHCVKNTELLRVMDLRCGLLAPLRLGSYSHGVLKLFFQQEYQITSRLQQWISTCAVILHRSLMRAQLYQKAQRMATIDGLTGLYNHRYFMEQLSLEYQRARRYRNWLSLIIVDIDYFKQYNDTNGHLAGDKVLRKVAQTIRNCVREMDLVARYGGEEFALLLPEINVENGMIVAEKIRREVETQRFANERKQPNGNLTISLGVAQNSHHLKNPHEMFNMADAALYRAKLEGRNRCAFAK